MESRVTALGIPSLIPQWSSSDNAARTMGLAVAFVGFGSNVTAAHMRQCGTAGGAEATLIFESYVQQKSCSSSNCVGLANGTATSSLSIR
jgi:hypothetical protein